MRMSTAKVIFVLLANISPFMLGRAIYQVNKIAAAITAKQIPTTLPRVVAS